MFTVINTHKTILSYYSAYIHMYMYEVFCTHVYEMGLFLELVSKIPRGLDLINLHYFILYKHTTQNVKVWVCKLHIIIQYLRTHFIRLSSIQIELRKNVCKNLHSTCYNILMIWSIINSNLLSINQEFVFNYTVSRYLKSLKATLKSSEIISLLALGKVTNYIQYM